MDNRQVVEALNKLLETTKDGEEGFRTCAGAVTSPRLKTVFEDAARRCDAGAAELQAEIRRLGGEPATSGTVGGSLHRAWTNVKSSVTGMDEYAVLAECERGEDVAKSAYEAALMEDLPQAVKAIVRRQYEGVKANHDRVRELRNQAAHAG
ncbi:MAG: PA2169 family four-helix-bundle protein [Methylocella sp.]